MRHPWSVSASPSQIRALRRLRRPLTSVALLALPLAFFAVFFAYPVAAIVGRGLRVDGRWQFATVRDVLGDPGIRGIVWFTLWQALASTVLTMLLAVPAAYVFARFSFRGKTALRALIMVPFVMPTVVVGAAFLALLGRNGVSEHWFGIHFDGSDGGIYAILAAHVFFNYAVAVRTVAGLWSHLDPRYTEAARVLGAGRWRAFWTVTLSSLRPALAAAALLVFLFTFTSFGVVQILGGVRYATLEVEIYRQTATMLDLPAAAALVLIQFAAVVGMLVAYGVVTRRRRGAERLARVAFVARRPSGMGERLLLAGNVAVMGALVLTPLGVLVERSFATTHGYSLDYYRALFSYDATTSTLFVAPIETVANSVGYAAAATAIACLVGGLVSAALTRRAGRITSFISSAMLLPLGISAVTVGFGFLITLDRPPLELRDSPLLIPIAQALVAIPFVVRMTLPVLRSINPRLREAAMVLGATPWRVWREVELAVVWRAGLAAAGFACAISLGEFGATVFIARPDNPTIPVAIAQLLGRPGELNYGQAMALSVVLMVLCAGLLLIIERIRLPKVAVL